MAESIFTTGLDFTHMRWLFSDWNGFLPDARGNMLILSSSICAVHYNAGAMLRSAKTDNTPTTEKKSSL